jgi:hypothetical protein
MELNNNYYINEYVEIVINPYKNKSSKNRKGLMVKGAWDNSLIDFINKHEIKALYLNSTRGWKTKNYSFLSELVTIEELHIVSSSSENLEALEQMVCLEEISLTTTTNSTINSIR